MLRLRVLSAFTLFSFGAIFAILSFAAIPEKMTGKGGMATGAPLAATANSGWSIVSSANINNGSRFNTFHDVTCISAVDCWAVGERDTVDWLQTLIEHWDGTSWSVVAAPNTSITQHNSLNSVTCTSASNCWAVGYYDANNGIAQTLVEHWDGASWSITSSPNTSAVRTNYLNGVTCSSPSQCWAVGAFSNGTTYQTLIEKWNGSSWTISTSPNAGVNQYNILSNVACASASQCWAVGIVYDGNTDQPLIERWDGNSWAIASAATTSPTDYDDLEHVVCVSASDCWAVGSYYTGSSRARTFIQHWNGVSWTVIASPNTDLMSDNLLHSVACTSSSDCWAVGAVDIRQTLVEHWNGLSWSIVSSPNPNPSYQTVLYGVACASQSNCQAVGYYNPNGANQTLVEKWDGSSWTITASPNINNYFRPNFLLDVACPSASDCWAVGYYKSEVISGQIDQTLIEHWDGTAWTVIDSPNTASTEANALASVTCNSASDCWAAGTGFTNRTLVVHWDGASWSIVSSPNLNSYSSLQAVTCTAASDCWAVGFYSDSAVRTLIEHWNGAAWLVVPSPNGAGYNSLQDVTCTSAANCWAVGLAQPGAAPFQTLIEHWDGSVWSIVSSPNTSPNQGNRFDGVTCTSAAGCWAVGTYFSSGGWNQTLIAQWDGASWSIVSSPNSGPMENNALNGITCAATSACWAVGFHWNGNANQTLVEQWNGVSWAIVTSDNTSLTQTNSLNDVACVSRTNCWAVGSHLAELLEQTLIEHYLAPPLRIDTTTRSGNGPFVIDGHGPVRIQIDIQASPDLITPFGTIATVASDANGAFHYEDVNAGSFQKRFYRAVAP
jgi:hypothetical protein